MKMGEEVDDEWVRKWADALSRLQRYLEEMELKAEAKNYLTRPGASLKDAAVGDPL